MARQRYLTGAFAEFETNLRKERQMEGIAKAKAAGVYKGRPSSIERTRSLTSRLRVLGHLRSPASSTLAARQFTEHWRPNFLRRLSMIEKMPEWSLADLEKECIKRLGHDPATRHVTRVSLVRLDPKGDGPNWTISKTEPPLTNYGWQRARFIVAKIAGTYAMAPDEL
jgi:hypothetical protein